ncbi:MAG: hypothetical protein M1819_003099 [Sarea resinae]|nr:MAG: hypothetical protein M1819_003099 [Sarea resinae]
MDSPGAIFSPSLARQQLAQARDWAYIDTFLSTLYHPSPVPRFERNGSTLKILLALAAQNETAEEEATILAAHSTSITRTLAENTAADPDAHIFSALTDALKPAAQAALTALASTSTALGTAPTADPCLLAQRLIDLTAQSADLAQQSTRLETLSVALQSQLEILQADLKTLKTHTAFNPPDSLPQKTADWTRGSKHLHTKLQDYHSRLASSPSASSLAAAELSLPELIAAEKSVLELQTQVRDLEGRVRAYKGLPHDAERAKREVERVGREVRAAERKRDRLFESLVESGGGDI